ncbi:uncharacterized protein LOC136033750 [Artemia franciscana]|uniref:Uncharacterized protein n=1 Tax=Artemia franciscana TaxID=6661 RepID=A0AA88LA62_ARTSF|nr:hypothetical protein QYM36_002369 [Artemia franciscana]
MKVLILLSSLIALSCSQYSIPVNPPLVQIASPSYSQSQLPAGSQAGGIRPVIFNYKATKSNSKSNTYYKPSPIPNAAKAPFPQQPLPNFPGKAQQELPKAPTSFFQQTSYQSKIVKQQNINPRPNSIIPVANLPVQNSPPVAKPYSSVKGNGGTAQYVSNSIQGSQGGQKTSYNTVKTVSQISQPSFSPLKPVSQNFQTSIVPQQATRAKGIKAQYNGLSPVQGQIPAPVDQSLKFGKSSYSGTQSGVTKGAFKSQNVQAFSSGQNIKQGYPKEIPSNPQALIPPPTAGQVIYARPTPAPVKISYETPSSKVSINGVTSPFQYSTTASLIEVTTPVPFTSNGFDQSNEYKGSAGGAIRNGGGFQNNAVQQNYRQKLISGSGTEANFQQPIPSPLEQPPQSFGPTEPGYKGNQASIVGGSQFSPQSASYNNGVPAKSLNTKVISAPENAYGNVNTAAISSAINQVNSQSSFQNNKEFNSQVNQFGSQSDYQSKTTENFGFKSGNQQDFVKQTQFEQKENSNAGYKKQVESAQGSEGQEQFFEEVQENTQVNNGGSGFSSLSDQTFSNGQSENAGKYGDQGSTVGSGFELEDVRQYEKR